MKVRESYSRVLEQGTLLNAQEDSVHSDYKALDIRPSLLHGQLCKGPQTEAMYM